MKIDIATDIPIPTSGADMIGNVYPIRGGFGARNGHMHVIIAHYDKVQGCCRYSGYCTVTVDCDGEIVGANSYALHYFDGKVPMAKVDGLENIAFTMRSL
jgi:hypothetical protein